MQATDVKPEVKIAKNECVVKPIGKILGILSAPSSNDPVEQTFRHLSRVRG